MFSCRFERFREGRGEEGMKEFLGALSFIFDSFVSFASLHRDKADKGNLFREGGKLLLVDVLFFPLLLLLLSLFRSLRNC